MGFIDKDEAIEELENLSANYTGPGDRNFHPHIDFMKEAIRDIPCHEGIIFIKYNPNRFGGMEFRCSRCGKDLSYLIYNLGADSIKFCINCGSQITNIETEEEKNE